MCLLSFDARLGEWWPREFAYIHTGRNRENQSPIDTTASYSVRFRVQDLEDQVSSEIATENAVTEETDSRAFDEG